MELEVNYVKGSRKHTCDYCEDEVYRTVDNEDTGMTICADCIRAIHAEIMDNPDVFPSYTEDFGEAPSPREEEDFSWDDEPEAPVKSTGIRGLLGL